MKSIYNAGDKVYLPEEDDFNDYEIVEVTPEESDGRSEDQFMYKIRPVNGQRTMIKSESEILPIIFC
jgi:hypothetical protein